MNKTNVMRILETAKIEYQAYEYDPKQGVDALSVAKYFQQPPERIFKTLVTIAPTHEHFVCVVPANADLDLKRAAALADVKSLEMIPLKQLLPTTGYIHGGCSPIGMKKQFKTLIDETAFLFPTIFVSGGKVGLTIELNAEELAYLIDAKFGNIVK